MPAKSRSLFQAPGLLIFLFAVVSHQIAAAANITWTNTGAGSWVVPSNWSGSAVPTGADPTYISNGGTATIDSGATAQTENLFVARSGTGSLLVQGQLTTDALMIGYSSSDVGVVTVAGGTMLINNTFIIGRGGQGTLNINGGLVRVAGSFVSPINIGFLPSGDGTVNLTSGTLSVAGSTLFVDGNLNVSGGLAISRDVRIAESTGYSGTLNLTGGVVETGTIALGAGAAALNISSGTLRARSNQGSFLSNSGSGTVTIGSGGAFFDTNGYDIGIGAAMDGAGGLTKIGSGTLTLTGANTYSGTTSVTAGALRLDSGGSIGAGPVLVNNAYLEMGASGTTTLAQQILGNANGRVRNVGGGLLILSGTNSNFAGSIWAFTGTVRLTNSAAAGNGSVSNAVVIGGVSMLDLLDGVSVGARIDLQGSGTGRINVSSGTASHTANITEAGGSRNWEKLGAGTFVMTGTGTNTGTTIVSGGVLQLGNGGTTGSINGNIINNAELAFNRSDANTYGGGISGTGNVYLRGSGTTTFTGANTYSGTTFITSGPLQIGDGGATGSITGAISNNRALIFNRSGALSYGGVISGTGSVIQRGSGTTTFTNANTYTGGTRVEQGTLVAGSSFALGGTQSYANVIVTGSNSTLRILSGVTINNKIQLDQSGTLNNAGLISTERFTVHSGSGGMYLLNTGTITAAGGFPSVSVVESIFAGLSTVNNDGGLITSPDAVSAVNLAYGGHVLNQNGGRLSADVTGVIVDSGTTNLITNTGSSSIVGNTGVFIASGTLMNSGGSTITGRDGNGVETDNSFGLSLLTNTGASTITGQVSGVVLYNDGFMATSGTVQNLAGSTIQSSMTSSGSSGVYMTGGGGAVINSGSSTITGRRYGVHLAGDGSGPTPVVSVVNNTGGSIISSSTASPGTAGVYVSGYRGNVTNDATSQILGRLWGVRLAAGGLVNNSGLISGVSSATTAGVTIAGASGTVSNSGTINGGVTMGNFANLVTLNIGSVIDGSLNVGTTNTSRLILDGASGTQAYSGAVTGTTAFSGTLVKQGAGTWIMDQTFSSTRGVVVSAGELRVGNGGTTGSINANVANSGLLSFNRSDATTFARVISGTGSLRQMGSGTTTLTGTNTYSGATTVSAGRLNVNGVHSGTGAVTVQSGAALGGTGSIAGAVTIEDGGILSAGNSAGTLRVGSLILNATSDLQFELGTTSDLVVVAGNLTLDGVLNVTGLAGFDYGTYTLFEYGGSLFNNGITFGLMPTGYLYAIDLSVAGQVRLAVFSPEQYWDGPNITPDGTVTGGSGTWNNTNTNWTTSSGSSNFAWNSSGTAIFSGTAGVVTVGETINVNEIVFATDGYSVTGPGDLAISGTALRVATDSDITALIDTTISGTGGLVKTGAGGRVILTGSNTYSGGTTIASGTLQVGNGGTTGSIEGDVVNDDTLVFNRSDDFAFGGSISGAGQVVVNQTGTLSLTGSSSYSGGTNLASGALLIGDDDALGTGALRLGAGTTFGVASGSVILVNDLTIDGDVSISLAGFAFLDIEGTVDLGAATRTLTFTEDFSNICFMGEITGAGGLTLEMADSSLSGLVTFCGADSNTFTGLTTVATGVELSLEKDPGAVALAGDLLVDVGGSVTLFDTSEQINPASTVTINGILGVVALSGTTTQTIGNLQGTGAIVNAFGPSVITVNAGDFAGSILDGGADPLALVKATSGTLTLSNANGYRGGTTINAGRLQTTDSSALGGGPVALAGGSLAPVGEISIASLDWTGGTIASTLGTTTSFVNISGALNLTGVGQFDFTADGGFLANNPYAILTAVSLAGYTEADFGGTALFGLTPTFSILGDTLYVSFNGATDGEIIQNGPPTFTPETAVFVVNGQASTAGPADSNTVAGLVFIPGSSLQIFNNLTVTSGNFTVGSGTATMNGGNVIVPGTFTKLGGGLLNILSNVLVGGNAFINEGILAVNGNFTVQNLFVQLNAMLKGAGIINGNVVNNGVVAPGNSPGKLTINGNFTQSSSGALQIEVASPTSFDELVVSGQASLAGALQVVSFDGYQFQFGDQFAFLQAGSITGSFDSITVANSGIFRGRFLVDGGEGSVVIAPASYTLVAQTTNQTNVAQALDSYIPATSGDRLAVSTALDLLTIQEYPAAFDQIAPTYYESLGNITIEQAFAQTQQIYQRLSAVRLGASGYQSMGAEAVLMHDKDGRSVLDAKDGKDFLTPSPDNKWGVWTMGNGLFGQVTNVSQVPNYRFNSGGFLVGGDYRWSENFVTGLFGGYQYTWADAGDSGNTQINSALFGGYASYTNGGFTADSVIGGGYNGYRVRRGIDFGTVDRLAKSQPNGGQFSAALNLGYDWQAGGFTFGPIVGAQYSYAGIGGFTENGADSLDLAVGQQNVNSLRTTLGGRVAYTWNITQHVALIPEVRMFWQHEFLNNPRNISSALDGGSGPAFGYETSAPARDSVFAGAGVSAQFGERWNGFLYYNIDFGRQDYLGNSVSAGLNWKF